MDISWLKANPAKFLNKLRLDALSIPHYVIKNGRPHGARHGKTEAQKQYHIALNAWRRCRKKKLKEFTIVSYEIEYIVTRNSKLAGPRRSASQWINWHKKTTPIVHRLRSSRDIGKLVNLTEQIRQKCTDETPIRLPNRCHNNEPSPPRIWRRTT